MKYGPPTSEKFFFLHFNAKKWEKGIKIPFIIRKYTLLPKYRQLRKDSQSNWFCGHFMNCSTIRIAPYHEETILDYCLEL